MNLNKMITIQRRGQSQDDSGQLRETWRNEGECWANIRPISGKEYFNASGARAEITHAIFIRFGAIVAPRDRIVMENRVFDVQSVFNEYETDRYLKIMAVENADAG